jgi:hypothetical protein
MEETGHNGEPLEVGSISRLMISMERKKQEKS